MAAAHNHPRLDQPWQSRLVHSMIRDCEIPWYRKVIQDSQPDRGNDSWTMCPAVGHD